jgi:hypothetical protein
MLRSELPNLKLSRVHRFVPVVCVLVAVMGMLSPAAGQSFTLAMGKFQPASSVNPGGESTSNVTINPNTTFTKPVDLSCAVTTTSAVTVYPICTVSQSSVTPPGSASAVVTTYDPVAGTTATPASYTVTVTGTSGAITQTASLTFTVLAVTADFTITVASTVAPNSVPAGSGAQATVSVNPLNGYVGVVTLACSSISPVTINPPVCTFTYPSGQLGLPVNAATATTTLTINTLGPPVPKSAVAHRRAFYAFWLPVPMLALLGVGAATGGRRPRKALGLLAVFVVGASLLLMPACGNSSTTTSTTNNGITPANTYTFTLTGVDQNGAVSSNTGTTNVSPTVALTVTAPTN